MTIETDLIAKIVGTANVSALISSRLYSQLAPQDATLPFLTYEISNTSQQVTLSGATNYYQSTLQIENYASSKAGVIDLTDKVAAVLHGFSGTLSTTTVTFAKVDSLGDEEEQEYQGQSQPKVWHRTIIFVIYWRI